MADKTLQLEVITPEQVAIKTTTTSVIIPGVDGQLGVLVDHAPLLAGLKPGVITYRNEAGKAEKLFVAGGFVVGVGCTAGVFVSCGFGFCTSV